MPKPDFLSITTHLPLFTDIDNQAYARLPSSIANGFYDRPLRSPAFREWFFQQCGEFDAVPTPRSFHHILNQLEARAHSDPDRRRFTVFRRVARWGHDLIPEKLFIDLAGPLCRVVEITAAGWRTTIDHSIHFDASPSAVELDQPDPALTHPDPLDALRSLLNFATRADWLRFLAFLLACFRPEFPFPVLLLRGPRSSGKTTAARILRSLVDPSASAFAPAATTARSLPTLVRHNWMLAFDHISALSPGFSDALCRLASGMGTVIHEPNASEPLLKDARRPIVLTVADRFSCPADLAEHSLTVDCAPLPAAARISALALNRDLLKIRDQLFAAICHALSTALRRLPDMELPRGRCADALAWALAASPALGCTEQEMLDALSAPPPGQPLVSDIEALLPPGGSWEGTATALLHELPYDPSYTSPKGLSQRLHACEESLAEHGIRVERDRTAPVKYIRLSRIPDDASPPDPPPPAFLPSSSRLSASASKARPPQSSKSAPDPPPLLVSPPSAPSSFSPLKNC